MAPDDEQSFVKGSWNSIDIDWMYPRGLYIYVLFVYTKAKFYLRLSWTLIALDICSRTLINISDPKKWYFKTFQTFDPSKRDVQYLISCIINLYPLTHSWGQFVLFLRESSQTYFPSRLEKFHVVEILVRLLCLR